MTNLVVFIAIIVVINLISLNLFFRVDFSKGKIYSLSRSSKDSIHQIEDRLIIKAYFTQELPPQFASIRRYTKDLLEEYKNVANGKLRYEFIDPKNEDRLREEAQKAGVYPVNIQVRENDRMEVKQAYLGLAFYYNDKVETIPLVQETRGLEYEITKTINKIASLGSSKVAFYGLTPDIPSDPRMRFFMQQQDPFQNAKETIRENYELIPADLKNKIPDDIQTLIFSGVVDSLETIELYNIDQFLMQGKSMVIFQDRVNANLQTQQAENINSNFFDLLRHYDIKIMDNLILDNKSGNVSVQERRGIFSVNTPMQYPFFPISNDVNKRSSVVSQLSNLQFIYVSEIDTTNINPDLHFTPLIYTSNQSGAARGPRYNIGIQQFQDKNWMNQLNNNKKVLAGLYEGLFTSYFNDSSLKDSDFIEQNYTKIILVPDMDFINSQAGGQNESNMNFLMNAIDYLSSNQALIELRSREVINKPLLVEKMFKTDGLSPEDVAQKVNRTRNFLKFANILLPSFLLIGYGLLRYKKEINRRKRIQEIYE